MLESPLIDDLIQLALREDLSLGDVTSDICVPPQVMAIGSIVARESLVVCGMPLIERIVKAFPRGDSLTTTLEVSDGAMVAEGVRLATVRGQARALLALERTVLNFLQRLSGVASVARAVASSAGQLTILDTRKTIPGWRVLDKYACRVGGVRNHRASLGDMVLVKNNHIDVQAGTSAADRVRAALSLVRSAKGFFTPIEVEVRSLEELSAALEFSPTGVMLDNMSDREVAEALALVRKGGASTGRSAPIVEVSGGVTVERVSVLAALGVDAVSLGSLTTKAPNKDISMRLSMSV